MDFKEFSTACKICEKILDNEINLKKRKWNMHLTILNGRAMKVISWQKRKKICMFTMEENTKVTMWPL